MRHRRRADAEVHLARARACAPVRTSLRLVVPRTIESSTTHDALARRAPSRTGLNLTRTRESRTACVRLDERAPDVVVADQPELERQIPSASL